jgi:hypothetical protein
MIALSACERPQPSVLMNRPVDLSRFSTLEKSTTAGGQTGAASKLGQNRGQKAPRYGSVARFTLDFAVRRAVS